MTVTGITEITKSRCKIEIDYQFAFVLYKGELRQYRLQEGEELEEDAYREIMDEVLPKRAKLRCMNLMQSREYTEAQLREKLKQGLYPEEAIDAAIGYVVSFRYLDDLRYAEDYITAHESARSRIRIEQDLLRKGVPGATIEQAWQKWEAKGGVQDEASMIRALLEKKNYNPDVSDFKEKQRLYAFLTRKGFSLEQICHALNAEW